MPQDVTLEKWDGPVKRLQSGPAKGKVLLPLGRTREGNWPVLALHLTENGWIMLEQACGAEYLRGRKVILIICLYQLLDRTEVWVLQQTWDDEGYAYNNWLTGLRRGSTSSSSYERTD